MFRLQEADMKQRAVIDWGVLPPRLAMVSLGNACDVLTQTECVRGHGMSCGSDRASSVMVCLSAIHYNNRQPQPQA